MVNSPGFISEITQKLDYDYIINELLTDIDFINGIISNIDINVDIDSINDVLSQLNVDDGLDFISKNTQPGVAEDFLKVDNSIARGTFDSGTRTNIEIKANNLVAEKELLYYSIKPLP